MQELPALKPKGEAALAVMERALAASAFLVTDDLTVADIALYAYTHVADEGGFELGAYPYVRAWLERVATRPRYVSIAV